MKKVLRLEHEQPVHSRCVVLNWCLGNLCNYACSYCPAVLHDGSIPWVDYETVTAFCTRAIEHYADRLGSQLYFEFTGGEVSHYPRFLELLAFLSERKVWNGMISNGSKAMRWWEQARPSLDHVCLSFHPESARVDHFKKVVQYLNEGGVTMHVNVMMLPEKFDECRALAEWVAAENENVTIALQPLLKNFSDEMYPYTEEQKQLLTRHEFNIRVTRPLKTYRGRMVKIFDDGTKEIITGPQLIANRENSWAGWKCWAGVTELAIDFHGNVYRGWCKEGGALGHVADPLLTFPEQPILCQRSYCHCVLDVMNERIPAPGFEKTVEAGLAARNAATAAVLST